MPDPEIGSVRFEKVVTINMIRVEPWNNSNDVNGGKDYRERVTVLAGRRVSVPENDLAKVVEAVLRG